MSRFVDYARNQAFLLLPDLRDWISEDDPNRADPDYARLIFPSDQPHFNHNGGWLGFGANGFLYLSFGDGGNADDVGEGHAPEGNAQAPGRLLGKILRIDVDRREADRGYAIPPDNPLVGRDGWRPEIPPQCPVPRLVTAYQQGSCCT